ncbi:MAG: glycosyltransferase family 4 protein [Acidimicrobiales bacterium]
MRVLTLTNLYPPHHYGGYELACRDVMERWAERGHQVTVLTSNVRLAPESAEGHSEVTVERSLSISLAGSVLLEPKLRDRWRAEQKNHQILDRALATVRPEVVSVWGMGAMSTSLLTTLARREVPIVYLVSDDWLTYAIKLDPWMRLWQHSRWLGRLAEPLLDVPARLVDVGRTGTFCFVSASTRDRAAAGSPWTFPDCTITHLGVDTRDFPIVSSWPRKGWGWRLICPARLDKRKGIATAIRAVSLLPEPAELTVCSAADEPYRLELEALVRSLGLSGRVSFEVVGRHELARLYREADLCLFPSEWSEPFGLVPLEAMAGGTPVVATGTGGSGEFLVDGVNCLRFPPEDHAALAKAVSHLAEEGELRSTLVANGAVTAASLTADRLADSLEAWHLSASRHFAGGRPAPSVVG